MREIILNPIGLVKNNSSEIVLNPGLEESLDGLEEYSHIIVVFWFDRIEKDARVFKKVIPYGLDMVGEKGVFATHMPSRPNPIGISIVKLLRINENILTVQNLDAFDDTPILDIKPYNGHPRDQIENFTIPKWEEEKQNNAD